MISLKIAVFILICCVYISCDLKQTKDLNSGNQQENDSLSRLAIFQRFDLNQDELNELTKTLRANSSITNRNFLKVFLPTDFYSSLQQKMNRIGIIKMDYYSNFGDTSDVREFDFTTDWKYKVPVHITNSSLSNDENKRGGYFKRPNGNEGWGMGDNWIIWNEYSSTTNDSFPPRYNGPQIKE
jgi:hypothetical protein